MTGIARLTNAGTGLNARLQPNARVGYEPHFGRFWV